jgi:hypothetical protein
MKLYSAKQYIKVIEEGPSHLFFDITPPPPAAPQGEVATKDDDDTDFDVR